MDYPDQRNWKECSFAIDLTEGDFSVDFIYDEPDSLYLDDDLTFSELDISDAEKADIVYSRLACLLIESAPPDAREILAQFTILAKGSLDNPALYQYAYDYRDEKGNQYGFEIDNIHLQ